MPKCDFSKVAKEVFRAPFPKNTAGGVLLRVTHEVTDLT